MWPKFYFAPDDPGGQGGGNDDDPGAGDGTGDGQPPEGAGSSADDDLVPREELSKVNREAAKYRRERNELQRQLREREDAEKSEVERLAGEVKDLRGNLTKTQAVNRDLRVQVLAEKVGIAAVARADAAKLLDWDSIEDPEDSALIEEALKALVKDRPYLRVTAGGADGGAGTGGVTTAAGMNDQIRRAAGRR